MTHPKPDELLYRLLEWLRSQGIELNESIIRHVVGISKSLETGPNRKRER